MLINNNKDCKQNSVMCESAKLIDFSGNTGEDQNSTLRKLSHELGNILTLVNSSLQIIESTHPEVSSFKYWNTTLQDIRYMKDLLTEVTYFNNSSALNLGPTNIASILNGAMQSFSHHEKYCHITFNCQAPVDSPCIIADHVKLKQAIINLIKNACESIENEGGIEASLEFQQDSMTLVISDSGCGMSEQQIENIFSPMITYKENGTGLGLSITSKIISAHGGTIYVQSEENVGTTFTITLPI